MSAIFYSAALVGYLAGALIICMVVGPFARDRDRLKPLAAAVLSALWPVALAAVAIAAAFVTLSDLQKAESEAEAIERANQGHGAPTGDR